MVDVAAVLKAWRAGEWQGRCHAGRLGVWWREDGSHHVSATLEEDGRWLAELRLDGEYSNSGFGDTLAEAVLSMIEHDAYARGLDDGRSKGGV